MSENLSLFNYIWDIVFDEYRLKYTPTSGSSLNVIYRVAKTIEKDFVIPEKDKLH